jgi:GMP synthase (glutamine-hydrolysing)
MGAQYFHFSGGEVAGPILGNMVELIYLILKRMKFEGVSVNSQVWMSHSDSVKPCLQME